MHVRLFTLGTPKVLRDGDEVQPLTGKRTRFGLFTYLAVEGEATRDRIVATFWPDSDGPRARRALSQAIYDLKNSLGSDWLQSSGDVIRTTSQLQVDGHELERAVEEGRFADGLHIYGGPFLDGTYLVDTSEFEHWVEERRLRYHRLHRTCLDHCIQEGRAKGDSVSVLEAAAKWVESSPLDEAAHYEMIRALAETGRRNEALDQYNRYEALLREELELDPMEETRELVERIRSGSLEAPGRAEAAPEPQPRWGRRAGMRSGAEQVGAGRSRSGIEEQLEIDLAPRYDVIRPVGHGSMGTVYLAREPALMRPVAVKVLLHERLRDEKARLRFEREAQSAGRLFHENICTVLDYGALSSGAPYFVMQFVPGPDLATRLAEEGPLSPDEVVVVARAVASALAAAHEAGVIHRDVRPSNVLHDQKADRILLCDFGIARLRDRDGEDIERLTQSGEVVGDPNYVSPEQMEGDEVTDRTDIYSLGVLIHELLTGRLPPRGEEGPSGPDSARGPARATRRTSGPTVSTLMELAYLCMAEDPTERPCAADVVRMIDERAAERPGRLARILRSLSGRTSS